MTNLLAVLIEAASNEDAVKVGGGFLLLVHTGALIKIAYSAGEWTQIVKDVVRRVEDLERKTSDAADDFPDGMGNFLKRLGQNDGSGNDHREHSGGRGGGGRN